MKEIRGITCGKDDEEFVLHIKKGDFKSYRYKFNNRKLFLRDIATAYTKRYTKISLLRTNKAKKLKVWKVNDDDME